jgi:ATP/ADP translocase
MKCHWSGVAELALAAPLLFVGLAMFVSKRKETRRVLAMLGVVIGAVVVAVPTVLIGVCGNADMVCNSLMRPIVVLAGILIMVISAASWALAERATEGAA